MRHTKNPLATKRMCHTKNPLATNKGLLAVGHKSVKKDCMLVCNVTKSGRTQSLRRTCLSISVEYWKL